MIPKYAYEVERHFALSNDGSNKRDREIKSFETLLAAIGFRDAAVRMHNTKRVVLRVILDEWSPSTATVGMEEADVRANERRLANGHPPPANARAVPGR